MPVSLDYPITDHILQANLDAVPPASTKPSTWVESYAFRHIHYPGLVNRMRVAFDSLELLIREVLAQLLKTEAGQTEAAHCSRCMTIEQARLRSWLTKMIS